MPEKGSVTRKLLSHVSRLKPAKPTPSTSAGVAKAKSQILFDKRTKRFPYTPEYAPREHSRLNRYDGHAYPGPPLTNKTLGFHWSLRDTSAPWHVLFRPPQEKGNILSLGPGPDRDYLDASGNPLGIPKKMRNWVQFMTTPAADTPGTTLVLHFDSKRYLIGNCAEGTQRASVQRKTGLGKVDDIFLTGKVDWKTCGGLFGMILTLADSRSAAAANAAEALRQGRLKDSSAGPTKLALNIHGSRNLTQLIGTARRFVFRKGLPLRTNEFPDEKSGAMRENWDPSWSDRNIKVWAMSVSPEEERPTGSRKRSHEEFSEDEQSKPSSNGDVEKARAEEEQRNDQLRKAVVGHMFDSDWRLDALKTTRLCEVKLPAAIFVRDDAGKIQKYTGPLSGPGFDPELLVLVRTPWPGALVESLPPTTPSQSSVSYIIKNHDQRGKFNPQEAKKLGVTPGPNFSKLTQGQSLTLPDGRVIAPDMVLGPTQQGTGFAVIDVPSVHYLEPLFARPEWSVPEIMKGVSAITWLLGPGVLNDDRFLKFTKFHTEWQHVVSSPDWSPNYLALESPAAAAIRLHLIDSERFPIPVHDNRVVETRPEAPALIRARAGCLLQLEPTFSVQTKDIIPYLDTSEVIRTAEKEVLKLAERAREQVTDPAYLEKLEKLQADLPGRDAEVITLGTGSALPSKYRNVSATLLRVPGQGNYLFDCGEGTLGQLKRVLGDELPQVLRDLKSIWISHLHADHHLGTASVIKAWHDQTKSDGEYASKKLIVASDEAMLKWLKEFSQIEDYGYSRLLPISMTTESNQLHEKFDAERAQEYGINSIQACRVDHCHAALAVVFDFPNGFKVAYSGDCRPSHQFSKIGQGATLLIHEATFDDELSMDAIAKKHSTTSEALEVGRKMDARRILLTHFSQRYQKIPVMERDGDKDQVAIVAFDYMKCKLGDFSKIEKFRDALLKLYEEKED